MMLAPWRALPPVITPVSAGRLVAATVSTATGGDASGALRGEIQRRTGVADVHLLDSGTSALRVALAMGAGAGSVVALPGYGCFDLATAALGAAVRVRLYDVDPSSLAPDLASLAEALEAGARAVVVASIFGYVPPMSEIVQLCRAHGATLIEDIAQGAGASWAGDTLGRFGDFVVMSFGRGKGVGGAGGGALGVRNTTRNTVWQNPSSSRRGLGSAALVAAQQVLSHPLAFGLPSRIPQLRLGETVYHTPTSPGGISALQAALALSALRESEARHAARAAVARSFDQVIDETLSLGGGQARDVRVQRVTMPPDASPGYLRLGLRCDDDLLAAMWSLGARRGYPIPLAQLTPLQPLLESAPHLAGSVELSRRLASLPTHGYVNDRDAARVRDLISPERP